MVGSGANQQPPFRREAEIVNKGLLLHWSLVLVVCLKYLGIAWGAARGLLFRIANLGLQL